MTAIEFLDRAPVDDMNMAVGIGGVHRGYRIDVRPLGDILTDAADENVRVYRQGCFLHPLYCTDTIEKATRWIDAFIAGETWAENSRRRYRMPR
jgi:hypothetical protein